MLAAPIGRVLPNCVNDGTAGYGRFLRAVVAILGDRISELDGQGFQPIDQADLRIETRAAHAARRAFELVQTCLSRPIIPVGRFNDLVRLLTCCPWVETSGRHRPISWLQVGAFLAHHPRRSYIDQADFDQINDWFDKYCREQPAILRMTEDFLPNNGSTEPFDKASWRRRILRTGDLVWCSAEGNCTKYLLSGDWHSPEGSHCWSRVPNALVAISLADFDRQPRNLEAEVSFDSFRHPSERRLIVTFDRAIMFDGMLASRDRIDVRLGVMSNCLHLIGFHVPTMTRPANHGSHDARDLGIALEKFWVHK